VRLAGYVKGEHQSNVALQIVWLKTCVLRNAGEHFRPDLIATMKGEYLVRPTGARQGSVRPTAA
jgi:hypothetical protein